MMKLAKKQTVLKVVLAGMLVMVSAMLACGCGASADNTIKGWKPADQQSEAAINILGGAGEYALAEFSADSSFRSVKFGIDCYKGSELVREKELGSLSLQEEGVSEDIQGGMIGCVLQGERLIMGCSYRGIGGSFSNIELPGYDEDSEEGIGHWWIDNPVRFSDGEKCYLSAFFQGAHGTSAEGFLESPELMEENEHTWLVYCIFSSQPKDLEQ